MLASFLPVLSSIYFVVASCFVFNHHVPMCGVSQSPFTLTTILPPPENRFPEYSVLLFLSSGTSAIAALPRLAQLPSFTATPTSVVHSSAPDTVNTDAASCPLVPT